MVSVRVGLCHRGGQVEHKACSMLGSDEATVPWEVAGLTGSGQYPLVVAAERGWSPGGVVAAVWPRPRVRWFASATQPTGLPR